MIKRNTLILTLSVYMLTMTSMIIGLSLPSGDTFLERILIKYNLPAYTPGEKGIYIPGMQLFVVILMSWAALKWIYKDQVSLWKNGLLLLILLVVVFWKVIIY
ncbi:hypothetical protein [Fusibacter ferrireducens]|uniref:DUF1648 domain-containing protein n=1 Tax=Fusibacter ferrireducens TaxID=2785058 RepID=A0ABR9ZWC1_9FIRM|nr:hypothetical protein [Fusibacter ferrireducens]MBF4694767.1 hypothetical protein [Fusibacter ferrireducens]